ncbi:MAG: hypothetical protein LZ163_06395 [Thaumarchaeota archaeon]|nr:hypothetical protein [Candidatus Terraquivivens yellowstonensis]
MKRSKHRIEFDAEVKVVVIANDISKIQRRFWIVRLRDVAGDGCIRLCIVWKLY